MKYNEIKANALLTKEKSDAEIEEVFNIVYKAFENLELVNTDGIKPADFPYELKRVFLREDIPSSEIRTDFKENIETNQDNLIVIKGGSDE